MWKSSIEWYNHSVHHWPGRRMARMTQQEIFEILMDGFAWSLEQWHDEKSLWNLSQVSGRYYEWNYECWRFAGYPIHQPDKKKLANAFKDKQGARPAVETDTDSNVADTTQTGQKETQHYREFHLNIFNKLSNWKQKNKESGSWISWTSWRRAMWPTWPGGEPCSKRFLRKAN